MLAANEVRLSKLRDTRLQKSFTQTRLAEKSGVAQGTISLLEAGVSSPNLDTALKLARALGVPVEGLIREN